MTSQSKRFDFDLTNPKDARKFFREYRTNDGNSIEILTFNTGRMVNVLTASDFEITQYASMICEDFYNKGFGYFVREEIH